jgi:hypothetical protein
MTLRVIRGLVIMILACVGIVWCLHFALVALTILSG